LIPNNILYNIFFLYSYFSVHLVYFFRFCFVLYLISIKHGHFSSLFLNYFQFYSKSGNRRKMIWCICNFYNRYVRSKPFVYDNVLYRICRSSIWRRNTSQFMYILMRKFRTVFRWPHHYCIQNAFRTNLRIEFTCEKSTLSSFSGTLDS